MNYVNMVKLSNSDPAYRSYVLKKIEELSPWYHKIDLGDGVITPGRDFDNIWNGTKKVIEHIEYRNKTVLDLGSWDGFWAFEAEKRGASFVVATDTRLEGYKNLLFAREVLDSKIIPLCNVPVQDLKSRLSFVGMPEKFDIIHHFGLFYHLRDPLLSLTQARHMISDDGFLIIETAYIHDEKNSYMMFSGLPGNHHFYAQSDTWAPTILCLQEILIRSFFNPVLKDKWQIYKTPYKGFKFKKSVVVDRITMIAKPQPITEDIKVDSKTAIDYRKVFGLQ